MHLNSQQISEALKRLEAKEMSGPQEGPNLGEATEAKNLGEAKVEVEDKAAAPRYSPLFNMASPAVDLCREKPWHRLAVILKAAGYTDVEVAKELEVTPTAVAYVWKQPWAQQMLMERMHGAGDAAMMLLHNETLAAAKRLIDIAKNAENDETRRKANNDILERKYGKPNQPYTAAIKSAAEMQDADLIRIATGN